MIKVQLWVKLNFMFSQNVSYYKYIYIKLLYYTKSKQSMFK